MLLFGVYPGPVWTFFTNASDAIVRIVH